MRASGTDQPDLTRVHIIEFLRRHWLIVLITAELVIAASLIGYLASGALLPVS